MHPLSGDWQPILNQMRGSDLLGLPNVPVRVPGRGWYRFHSNLELQRIAQRYNRDHGLGAHPTDYSGVDLERAVQVAEAYDLMAHVPGDPRVRRSYDALRVETWAQYEALISEGYSFEFYPDGEDPYYNSPREAIYDLTANHHMYVFPTVGSHGGFGQEPEKFLEHPLREAAPGVMWGTDGVTYNDIFRAVHDSLAHAKEGVGFGPVGEDNAYRQHAAMFSQEARMALASETRGQNTWVNFGPHGAHNRAYPRSTIYADQKAGILPDWAICPDFLRR